MSHTEIFENISLAAKPRIIKTSPKSDMAIIWFDIWDSQSGSSTKLLINHFFNFSRYITTIRATNMNPVSQTSFGHISISSLTIPTVSMAPKSPWKDLSIDTSHISKWSVMAEILGRSTGNHHGTVY